MRWILGLLIVAGAVGLIWVGLGLRWWLAAPEGKVAAQEQIQSAGSRIAAYDHFFNLCASIQTDEAALEALTIEQQGAVDDRNRARIAANITGVSAARLGAIRQYNADARKDYTVGQFRDNNLPYQLPPTTWNTGVQTSCGNG